MQILSWLLNMFIQFLKAKEAYSDALYDSVSEQYEILKSAIQGSQGLEASTHTVSLSQPWDFDQCL